MVFASGQPSLFFGRFLRRCFSRLLYFIVLFFGRAPIGVVTWARTLHAGSFERSGILLFLRVLLALILNFINDPKRKECKEESDKMCAASNGGDIVANTRGRAKLGGKDVRFERWLRLAFELRGWTPAGFDPGGPYHDG